MTNSGNAEVRPPSLLHTHRYRPGAEPADRREV